MAASYSLYLSLSIFCIAVRSTCSPSLDSGGRMGQRYGSKLYDSKKAGVFFPLKCLFHWQVVKKHDNDNELDEYTVQNEKGNLRL
jgi:hypothetical protein